MEIGCVFKDKHHGTVIPWGLKPPVVKGKGAVGKTLLRDSATRKV